MLDGPTRIAQLLFAPALASMVTALHQRRAHATVAGLVIHVKRLSVQLDACMVTAQTHLENACVLLDGMAHSATVLFAPVHACTVAARKVRILMLPPCNLIILVFAMLDGLARIVQLPFVRRIALLAGHGVMSLEGASAMLNGMVPYAINAPLVSLRMSA